MALWGLLDGLIWLFGCDLQLKQREEKAGGGAKTKTKTSMQADKKVAQFKEQKDARLVFPAAMCIATTYYIAPAVLVLVLAFVMAQYMQEYLHGM